MDEKICETPITGEYVAKHMKEALGPHAILTSCEAKRIAVGQGFVSHILLMKLKWVKDQDDLPKSVIVKVPVVESIDKLMKTMTTTADEGEKIKSVMAQMVLILHKSECNLYRMFGHSPPIAMPKFYVALPVTDDAPGMIILEDLSEKASSFPSWIKGLTLPQTLQAVTEIARLHGWSLKTKIDWQNQIPKIEDLEPVMRGFLAPMTQGLKKTKEECPDEFGSIDLEKLQQLITYETFAALMNEHRQLTDDVLVHGDFHLNNMMFEKNTDGSPSDRLAAVIDFQAALRGNPAYDVAHLFVFSLPYKLRRQHEAEILQRYYDEVKSIAGDKFKIDFDQFRRLHDRQFAFGAVMMVASIPMMNAIMIKSEGEQKVKEEKEVLENIKANYDDAAVILSEIITSPLRRI